MYFWGHRLLLCLSSSSLLSLILSLFSPENNLRAKCGDVELKRTESVKSRHLLQDIIYSNVKISIFFFLLLWNDSNFHSSTALYLPYLQNVSENDYSLCLKKYLNICFLVDLSIFNQLLLYCLKIYSGKIESLYRSWWIKNKWPNGRESIHDSLWIGLYNVKTWG